MICRMVDYSGTFDVFLANHALHRGYKVTLITYNFQLFDPDLVRSAERADSRAAGGASAGQAALEAPADCDARL